MKRILVVDGEPVALGALCDLLEMDGFAPVGLAAGEEAIHRLRSERFDAVVTDVELPGGQGLELVRAALEVRPKVPVLVMTGQVSSAAAEAALSLGACCVLGKPLRYEALVSELRSCTCLT
jgi:DNA-binding NtrC family response regulator